MGALLLMGALVAGLLAARVAHAAAAIRPGDSPFVNREVAKPPGAGVRSRPEIKPSDSWLDPSGLARHAGRAGEWLSDQAARALPGGRDSGVEGAARTVGRGTGQVIAHPVDSAQKSAGAVKDAVGGAMEATVEKVFLFVIKLFFGVDTSPESKAKADLLQADVKKLKQERAAAQAKGDKAAAKKKDKEIDDKTEDIANLTPATNGLLIWIARQPSFREGAYARANPEFRQLNGLMRFMQYFAWAGLGLIFTFAALRFTVSGAVSGSFDAVNAVVRTAVAAILIAAWPWLFGQLMVLSNVGTHAILSSGNVREGALDMLNAAVFTSVVSAPIGGWAVTILFVVLGLLLMLGLLVAKVVTLALLAIVFAAGPLAIMLWPLPETSRAATTTMRLLLGLAVWPILWALCLSVCAVLWGDSLSIPDDVTSVSITEMILKPLSSLVLLYLTLIVPLIAASHLMFPGAGGSFYRGVRNVQTVKGLAARARGAPSAPSGRSTTLKGHQTGAGGGTQGQRSGGGSKSSGTAGVGRAAAAGGAAGAAASTARVSPTAVRQPTGSSSSARALSDRPVANQANGNGTQQNGQSPQQGRQNGTAQSGRESSSAPPVVAGVAGVPGRQRPGNEQSPAMRATGQERDETKAAARTGREGTDTAPNVQGQTRRDASAAGGPGPGSQGEKTQTFLGAGPTSEPARAGGSASEGSGGSGGGAASQPATSTPTESGRAQGSSARLEPSPAPGAPVESKEPGARPRPRPGPSPKSGGNSTSEGSPPVERTRTQPFRR